MKQKNYYSERQLNLDELLAQLSPLVKIHFGIGFGLQIKLAKITPVIDVKGLCQEFDSEGKLALMLTWQVEECDEVVYKHIQWVYSLFYLPELKWYHSLHAPEVWLLDKAEIIYQEDKFMYAKVQPDINDWYVGMIEQTEPVLSEEDALKFICSHWFVEEKRYDDALSSALKVSLAGRDNSLFWVADNLEREFYELDAKAQKLDAYNMWVRIYAQPECLGKKVYAGKEAFWHFDGKKLHASKGEYLSDKEACKIYLQHLGNVAPMEHPLPLVDANSVGIERFWLVAKSGTMNFLVSAHTGKILMKDDKAMTAHISGDTNKDEGFIFE